VRIQRQIKTPKFGWKRQESRHGLEYFHYPSDLARQLWLYPFCIGRARTPPDESIEHVAGDRYLLHYVERGELWHRRGDRIYIARSGEACLMDLGREFTHGTDGPHAAQSYWVAFNGKDMERCFLELGTAEDPVFTGLNTGTVTRLFRELMCMTRKEDVAYEWKAAALLTSLLSELYAARTRKHPPVSLGAEAAQYSAPVRQGIDWVVREYYLPYSVKELFRVVGYSRSYYTRMFRSETGVPPQVWLNRYRIEQARRLLMYSHKSIGQIARAVGIPDRNYFARLFRQEAGIPARAYRLEEGVPHDARKNK
jgi:AraC-like DNA-binding protein